MAGKTAARRAPELEDMDTADSLFLQQILLVHQQLEERLTAKMESYQRSMFESMQQGWRRQASASSSRRQELWGSTGSMQGPQGPQGKPAQGNEPRKASGDSEGDPGAGLEHVYEGELTNEMMAEAAIDGDLLSEQDSRPPTAFRAEPSIPAVESLDGIQNQLADNHTKILKSVRSVGSGSGLAIQATRLATNGWFEVFIAVSITLNAVSIGWNTDWSMKNPGQKRPLHFVVLDWSFLAVFMFELLLRMVGEGWGFWSWKAKMFGWNMFDSLVVFLTLLNEVNILNVHLSVVRVFRVLRLVYVVRMVRLMKGFRELRMMVSGIMNCGKTLLWSAFLLTVITYIYAVVCLQISAEWLSDTTVGSEGLSAENQSTVTFLQDNFPSLNWSIYTLFKVVTGGVNWGDISDPLERVNLFLIASFPLFIVVTIFCVLNIITAAFVEAASRTSQEEDATALEHIEERKKWIKDISLIFSRHDSDRGGNLDWDEFQSIMSDWRTHAAFKDIGIDLSFQQAKNLFVLFDFDGDGRIDINEFAQGVHHLRGNARSLDMFRSFLKMERTMERLTRRLMRGDDEEHDMLSAPSRAATFTSGHNGVPAHPTRLGSSVL